MFNDGPSSAERIALSVQWENAILRREKFSKNTGEVLYAAQIPILSLEEPQHVLALLITGFITPGFSNLRIPVGDASTLNVIQKGEDPSTLLLVAGYNYSNLGIADSQTLQGLLGGLELGSEAILRIMPSSLIASDMDAHSVKMHEGWIHMLDIHKLHGSMPEDYTPDAAIDFTALIQADLGLSVKPVEAGMFGQLISK